MKYKQVFVRGKNKDGEWDGIDVLKLDNQSFKAFVVDVLFRNGLVVGLRNAEGEDIIYHEKNRGVPKWVKEPPEDMEDFDLNGDRIPIKRK